MAAGRWLQAGCVLLLTVGCRTATPELKPLPEKEVLNSPPNDARYSSGGYPKQAFDTSDPTKRNIALGTNTGVGPAMRNSVGPGGGGGGAGR